MLRLRDPFPRHQYVQGPCSLDVVHGLLVRHHSEVVAVKLEDLVVNQKTRLARGAVRGDLRDVDTVVSITLRNKL